MVSPLLIVPGVLTNVAVQPIEYSPPLMVIGAAVRNPEMVTILEIMKVLNGAGLTTAKLNASGANGGAMIGVTRPNKAATTGDGADKKFATTTEVLPGTPLL